MALVNRFPLEITVEIISLLSLNDLASVSRVSRDLQSIAEPFLYQEPSLMPGTAELSSLYIFVRTLLTPGREMLRSHVRTLMVDWSRFRRIPPTGPESDIALFTAAGSRLGIQNPLSSDGGQVVLCLHLLPFLRTIDIIPSMYGDDFEDFIESHHATESTLLPLGLQSIREFNWHSSQVSRRVSYTMLITLMRLPSIQSIDVYVIEEYIPFPEPDEPSTSGITNLHFSGGAISEISLTRILKIPRALTRFTYNGMYGNNPDLGLFSNALKPLQQSLQYLEINLLNGWSRSEPDDPLMASFASLRDWPMLHIVRIAPVALLGMKNELGLAQVLPAGLCAFGIMNDYFWSLEDVVEMVLVMLEQKAKRLPRLRRLALSSSIRMNPELCRKVRVACMAVGVEEVGLCGL